tara:strand:+ start:80 stop:550 length:471 start_codon:yes stop_codon:yes gene_type:complete
MIFYHYTCIEHIEEIFSDGFLKASEANISPVEAHIKPDVVWLFKKPWVGQAPKMLSGSDSFSAVDKTRICITVDVPMEEVQRADKFWKRFDTPDWWIKALEKCGGKTNSKDWHVITRNIPSTEWIEVRDRYSNQKINVSLKRKQRLARGDDANDIE